MTKKNTTGKDLQKIKDDFFRNMISSLGTSLENVERINEGRYSLKINLPGLFEADKIDVDVLMRYLTDVTTLKMDGFKAIHFSNKTKLKKIEELLAKISPGARTYLLLPKNADGNSTLLSLIPGKEDGRNSRSQFKKRT